MKRTLLLVLLICLLGAVPAGAAVTFVLDPASGNIFGMAGETIGWGFTFTADDSQFYVLNLTDFCVGAQASPCSNSLGVYADFAATVNGLIIGPGYTTNPYSEVFDNPTQKGIGSFTIDNSATVGQFLAGTIYVNYDVYGQDPSLGGSSTPGTVFADAEVFVTPEPGTWGMMVAGLGVVVARLRRRIQRAG